MAIFNFDESALLGQVRAVDTRSLNIHVSSDENLRKARVGQLVAVALPGPLDEWLVGIIVRVLKSVTTQTQSEPAVAQPVDGSSSDQDDVVVVNSVQITLVGTISTGADNQAKFTRSLVGVPEIDGKCHVLRDRQLEAFMGILSGQSVGKHSLDLGCYTLDERATAYLDGNKFFQRHAALLGSTGSGKSWTVASILERAARLPSANLIVFDLHGEYRNLPYARQLRIPGPEELGGADEALIYLPYWLLNSEEMQALFIERTEFTAHNQVMALQELVSTEKQTTLQKLGKQDVLNAFTVDSPIPFSLENVIQGLTNWNEEMEQGTRGLKQGKFYGQFSRLLARIGARLEDKRYGFLFQAPPQEHQYDAMGRMATKLMNYSQSDLAIKVIDFSEVPAEVLPVIVALVARLIYQVQFWTDRAKRQPLALVCDEAHLYIARKEGANPAELRAIESFEKIAKEGRKYGVAILIVSQRPSDVSPTVLSQCHNVISLRLTTGEDRNTVHKLMPESLEPLMDVLPILDVGEAVVVGDAVLLPSRIRVTAPKDKPLSTTINFWTEWDKAVPPPDFARAVENMRRQSRK
ncbi:MAG: ATP-binding protein [Verrucomicrobia bacterium]|nr:ATP-binding protein [Verrucomicrobiota bacterium]